jgi:UDP-2-acetamido-2-deoxy-ribo-hexuluronate aminotransferase
MKEIQMVDLGSQYERLKPEIDSAIKRVIDSTAFIKGPDVERFEQEMAAYLGIDHVVACGNGTDALQIAMMALGLKPGDEVITTNFTFIATVEVVALLGLKPVLTDPCPDSFNITPEAIEKAITPATRAIVPVHLFGQCCNMEPIIEIARKHNLYIIEDTAQANGADYVFSNGKRARAGTMGHVGCTSFFPSKNLGCYGDGGALMTCDPKLAAEIRSIINHGMKVRYYHDHIGVNSRLDTIQAAILRVKLEHLDNFNRARNEAAAFYDKAFAAIDEVTLPARVPWSTHIFHQYTLRIANGKRDALKTYLNDNGIPAMIYYPVAISRQKAYRGYNFPADGFPITEMLSGEVLSLPMHTELNSEQLGHITSTVINFFKKR